MKSNNLEKLIFENVKSLLPIKNIVIIGIAMIIGKDLTAFFGMVKIGLQEKLCNVSKEITEL